MKIVLIALFVFGLVATNSARADSEQMKQTLSEIVDQLNAIKPLINQAESEQGEHERYSFHFEDWIDARGAAHAGLKEDIETLQDSLTDAINKNSVDPRRIQPIKNDFIGRK